MATHTLWLAAALASSIALSPTGTPVERKPDAQAATAQSTAQRTQSEKTRMDWANLERYAGENAALRSESTNGKRVIFFGDSLTEHWGQKDASGASPTGNFLQLHGYLNRGISGQTTPQMLVRFRQDVLELTPAVLVLLAGSNDIAGNTGPMTLAQTEGNLQSMVELARVHGITVVLCTLPPARAFWWAPAVQPSAAIQELNRWIRAYASAEHLILVDYYPALVDAEGGMQKTFADDGVHPNRAGYAVMQPLAEDGISRAVGTREALRRSVGKRR